MLSAMRHTVLASRALHAHKIESAADPAAAARAFQASPDPDLISWRQALWLGTQGGARALGLQASKLGGWWWVWAPKHGARRAAAPARNPPTNPHPPPPDQSHPQDVIGSFAPGKSFDALLVDGAPPGGGPYDLFPSDTREDAVEKFVNLGDDRCIRRVWVAGREVAGADRARGGGGGGGGA